MNLIKVVKNICLPTTELGGEIFISRYDLSMRSRIFRYGYLALIVTIAYIFSGYVLSILFLSGLPILFILENMRIVVKIEKDSVLFDTPFFGFKRTLIVKRSEIQNFRLNTFSNRLIIERQGKKNVKIMASLPPGISVGENSLEKFLRFAIYVPKQI